MQHALILSPFATAPLDAGHRRRVFHATELLKRRGYRITFLFHAYEAGWRRRFDDALYAEMAAQWDEVIVFHAGWRAGQPPGDGAQHGLDEWWNPDLGTVLANLLAHRFFDVFVVHQLWLSKAFETAPRRTLRVLHTHGLFSPRRDMLDRLAVGGGFFLPSPEDERHGIDRADLAVTVRDADAEVLAGQCLPPVVTLPFFDAELERRGGFSRPAGYLGPERVIFGLYAAAGGAGAAWVQAVQAALEARPGDEAASVDLLIGGGVQDELQTALPFRRAALSEPALYRQCDVAVLADFSGPDAEGPGAGTALADCLALGVPVLAAAAAAGAALDPAYVADSPAELAALMVTISRTRPDLAPAQAAVAAAKAGLSQLASFGAYKFLGALNHLRVTAVFDLRAFDFATGVAPLTGYLSLLPHLSWHLPMLLILADEAVPVVENCLPVGVSVVAASLATPRSLAQLRKQVLDASASGKESLGIGSKDRYLADPRWLTAPDLPPAAEAVLALPLVHPDIRWEAAVDAVRRHWQRREKNAGLAPPLVDTIVFVDHLAETVPSLTAVLTGVVWMLNLRRRADLTAAVLRLLEAGEGTVAVVWASADRGALHRMVLEICALRRLAFHGVTPWGAVLAGVPYLGEGSVGERLSRAFDQAFAEDAGPLAVE